MASRDTEKVPIVAPPIYGTTRLLTRKSAREAKHLFRSDLRAGPITRLTTGQLPPKSGNAPCTRSRQTAIAQRLGPIGWHVTASRHGFPSLWQIAPKNPAGEFGVPFLMPPYNDDPTMENTIARNGVQGFSRKAKEQANV